MEYDYEDDSYLYDLEIVDGVCVLRNYGLITQTFNYPL
jgi:hypothetical protein